MWPEDDEDDEDSGDYCDDGDQDDFYDDEENDVYDDHDGFVEMVTMVKDTWQDTRSFLICSTNKILFRNRTTATCPTIASGIFTCITHMGFWTAT